MLRSAPHHICWASTHRSETCGGIMLPMRRHWPLLTGRPWRNRAVASQPRPQFMRHGHTDLCRGCTKILSTRNNNKCVNTVLMSSQFCFYLLNIHLFTYTFWHARTEAHTHKHTCIIIIHTRIVDYYYVWKAYDDTGRSLTCSGQLHIIYVEPVPTGKKHVEGSCYLCAGTDYCWPVGLGKIGHLPANLPQFMRHGHTYLCKGCTKMSA